MKYNEYYYSSTDKKSNATLQTLFSSPDYINYSGMALGKAGGKQPQPQSRLSGNNDAESAFSSGSLKFFHDFAQDYQTKAKPYLGKMEEEKSNIQKSCLEEIKKTSATITSIFETKSILNAKANSFIQEYFLASTLDHGYFPNLQFEEYSKQFHQSQLLLNKGLNFPSEGIHRGQTHYALGNILSESFPGLHPNK